jgi:hypothetical protein
LLSKKEDTDITLLLDQIVSETIVEGMKRNIDTLGNEKTWELIEKLFHKAEQRIKFRKYFFEAGGELPKKEGGNL